MNKTDWPIRWDLLLRYRLIEIIALWEGRLTTNHICHAFGIGRQQASKDINTYLREVAPGNLVYDRHLKGYVPARHFRPTVTQGRSHEYQELLSRDHVLSDTFESLELGLPNTEVLTVPRQLAAPEIVRQVVMATRQGRRLEVECVSLSNPKGEVQLIEPHVLVCSGRGWHVRAWSERSGHFRDFSLSRFRGTPRMLSERSRHRVSQDEAWNTTATIVLRPSHRYTSDQQAVIARDYGMEGGELRIETRGALVSHTFAVLGLNPDIALPDPIQQKIEIANPAALRAWLGTSETKPAALSA